ncbi:pab-dependent polya-specific ribonuclease subunit pan3 [Gigaspora margarita]|uniref:PAN2-PAN3 deadenylation complex subunit PAN3 n=2 Tax=Gigaspora margarita TaxID=4874 RepID=A0A8H4A606_GIGMA|nr:pab-dependent polya-specific ribonuclease subunit pan3 [Gigaspora margarita]
MSLYSNPTQSGSAAIPIVAPTSEKEIPKNVPSKYSTQDSKARTCRNLIIHGYCKYEGKGCKFNHDLNKSTSPPNSPETAKSKLSVNSPVFKPSTILSTISPEVVNAPPFIPKNQLNVVDETPITPPSAPGSPQKRLFYDSGEHEYDADISMFDPTIGFYPSQPLTSPKPFLLSSGGVKGHGLNALANSFASLATPFSALDTLPDTTTQHTNNTSYFTNSHYANPFLYQSQQTLIPQPLQYHLYTSPLPHVSNLHPHQKTIHAFFMSDHLREELQQKNEVTLSSVNAKDFNLPEELHVYHSLYPLDLRQGKSVKIFGYPSFTYKSICNVDGRVYCLRRIEGFRLTNEIAMSTIESWRRIRHANIVSIREAFTTKAFGDHSLVFVYDYHPLSQTLFDKHFSSPIQNAVQIQGVSANIPETVLWSYIVQLASAIKTIHASNLAARMIEPTKILLTGKNRIRVNCCGIMDMLAFDGGKNIHYYQQEDLLHFGHLIISLACNSLTSIHNLPKSIELISRQYSHDLKNVILYLISKPTPDKTIDDVVTMIAPKILHEINSAHHYNDFLESELSKELENGRLVRLLCKFGFINERPEFDMDPSWSETGDRYLIKLFRDYVFHQVDEHGYPVVDMSHVLTCLNKLDTGVDERIMLMSRDEQSCLIVSYKEIKNCIDSAFRDLSRRK